MTLACQHQAWQQDLEMEGTLQFELPEGGKDGDVQSAWQLM